MKRLLIAALIPYLALSTAPSALADELSPPCVALNSPVAESSSNPVSPLGNSLKAEVPVVLDGKNPGIDIVNDSLKYHSALGIGNQAGNQRTANSPYTYNLNASRNRQIASRYPYQNQMQANSQSNMQYGSTSMQNMYYPNQGQMMQSGQPQISPEMMKKAVGVMGAAALVGVFVKSGGLKGVTRSMGWDNRRRIRGSSIGGY